MSIPFSSASGCRCIVATAAAIALAAGSAASGAVLMPGQYVLHNHPDGNAVPPPYGMKLDELYNVTADHDIFTFNFDDAASSMVMDVTATTIHIYGASFGGRDIGGDYAVDPFRGVYAIDFLYTVGVQPVVGDDDMEVRAPSVSNFGTIHTPLGDTIALTDKTGNDGDAGRSFRLGDEDNDLGHRGYNGISGWGWLTHGPDPMAHIDDSDWLFTATKVPAPVRRCRSVLAGLAGLRRKR